MEDDHNHHEEGDTNVRVAVRCRPFNDREKAMNAGGDNKNQCVEISGSNVIITGPNGEEHSFAFDNVFDMRSTQPEVWESVGLPILEKAFSGYNGTIFAYGQTGSGKTWSMQGADGDLEGVIPRMNNSVFERIATQKAENPNLQFLVTASYFELYNEIIFDLLDPTDRKKRSKSGLEIKEHPVLGVYVKGLQEIVVDNPHKMQAILDQGMKSRTVASTQMNADSSRSHSVFTIKVHQKDSQDESKNLFAKVNLVDLAGSERVKSTGATGATLKEGANINKSLSALGNVINALVECAKGKKGVFVPYRNSKLTRVLQESLGGNSITVMVAALSPASCNFEETLSTLKYANRAKAIKVKAIKNDESSQISRLNDEIRMLKEKLVTQHSTVSPFPSSSVSPLGLTLRQVDTSLLEAKHQQQLRDLEEAMKSTWEEKARISKDHERDRARLEREQQESQKLLARQRDDSWKLLETKGDVELSISHVKDLLRVAQPDGGTDRIASWMIELKEILKLEAELSEQYTVVDVYQSSLLRDSEVALKDKKNSSNLMADKMVVGQWKQLRDKYEVISLECQKWIQIRSTLINSIEIFLNTISVTNSLWQENQSEYDPSLSLLCPSSASLSSLPSPFVSLPSSLKLTLTSSDRNLGSFEVSQVSRGLHLVLKQVREKHQKYISSSAKMIHVVAVFSQIATKMEAMLQLNLQKLTSSADPSTSAAAEDTEQEKQTILSEALSNLNELKAYFRADGLLDKIQSNGLSHSGSTTRSTSKGISLSSGTQTKTSASVAEESMVQVYERIHCSNGATVKKAMVGGSECWVLSSVASLNDSEMPFLEITLPHPVHLSAVTLQGGIVPLAMQQQLQQQQQQDPSAAAQAKGSLPCGLGFDDCNGSVENTVKLLGDVISWETLIKKNSPEKFLARPPVRFLFDLINLVTRVSNLSVYQSTEETSWEIVGSNKESKMAFIDKILAFVSNSLSLPSPTTSAAIISGSDAPQTNLFLQQLALVGYASQQQLPLNSLLPRLPPPQLSPRAMERNEREKLRARENWLDSVRIAVSSDGIHFDLTPNLETNLMSANDTTTIPLSSLSSASASASSVSSALFSPEKVQSVKAIRLYAVSWDGSMTCLRFNLSCFLHSIDGQDSDSQETKADKTGTGTETGTEMEDDISTTDFQNLLHGLLILKNSSDLLARVLNFLIMIQELETLKKQDEVRKRMENLVDEKLLLEQKLATEKLALKNEKQGLEEQLKLAQEKLLEAEQLLAQEKSLSEQYESLHQQGVIEKMSLQQSLTEQMEENSLLRSELLKFQAKSEKEMVLMENYRKRIEEDEVKLTDAMEELESFKSQGVRWEEEKEDLLNQIMILTDERDGARQQEEELYGILKEKTNDLERLQESYVDMTDRCNDYQDTMADMREEMESLKEVMLVESRQFITASQSSTAIRGKSASADHPPGLGQGQQGEAADAHPTLVSSTSFTASSSSSSLPNGAATPAPALPLLDKPKPATLATAAAVIAVSPAPPVDPNPTKSSPPTITAEPSSSASPRTKGGGGMIKGTTEEAENYGDDNDFEDDFEDDFES